MKRGSYCESEEYMIMHDPRNYTFGSSFPSDPVRSYTPESYAALWD